MLVSCWVNIETSADEELALTTVFFFKGQGLLAWCKIYISNNFDPKNSRAREKSRRMGILRRIRIACGWLHGPSNHTYRSLSLQFNKAGYCALD